MSRPLAQRRSPTPHGPTFLSLGCDHDRGVGRGALYDPLHRLRPIGHLVRDRARPRKVRECDSPSRSRSVSALDDTATLHLERDRRRSDDLLRQGAVFAFTALEPPLVSSSSVTAPSEP